MGGAQRVAYRFRFVLLVLALLCDAAAVTWWLWFGFTNYSNHQDLVPLIGIPGLWLFLQWFFLRPRRGWTLKLTDRGRPMWLTLACAGLVMGAMTVGMIGTGLELGGVFDPVTQAYAAPLNAAVEWMFDLIRYWKLAGPVRAFLDFLGRSGVGLVLYIFMLISPFWIFWAVFFYLYKRQDDRYARLSRMVRWVMAGSIVDLLVGGPTFALVKDPHDCYCGRGSFLALVFGIPALLWAFGPGVVLLFLHKRYMARRGLKLCTRCGYDLRASSGSCPECGEAMR